MVKSPVRQRLNEKRKSAYAKGRHRTMLFNALRKVFVSRVTDRQIIDI